MIYSYISNNKNKDFVVIKEEVIRAEIRRRLDICSERDVNNTEDSALFAFRCLFSAVVLAAFTVGIISSTHL